MRGSHSGLGLGLVLSVIFHKAFADIALLAQKHSGTRFLAAVARYLLKNLAGG
jgi:hypothetical protein